MQLTLVTDSSEPVTVQQLKDRLRLENDDSQNGYLGEVITEARQAVEGFLAQSLLSQTWRAVFDRDELGGACMDDERYENFDVFLPLPMGPIQSITSVIAYDTAHAAATLTADEAYKLVAQGDVQGVLALDGGALPALRRDDAVEVVYVTGKADLADVSMVFKGAVLRLAALLFLNPAGYDGKDDFLELTLGMFRARHL